MSFAEFANLAGNKYDEQKQIIDELKNSEAFKAMAEAQKGKKPPTVAEAFDALADITEDEEFSMIKRDFARGMEVIAERRAIMQNMTEEERAEYKAEMAAFMAEQGLSENRYSLSALKSVDAEDVANMTAFMEQLAMDMGGPIDGPLPEKDQSQVRSLSESFTTLIRNISGSELNDDERQAMSPSSTLSAMQASTPHWWKPKPKSSKPKAKTPSPIPSWLRSLRLNQRCPSPPSSRVMLSPSKATAPITHRASKSRRPAMRRSKTS